MFEISRYLEQQSHSGDDALKLIEKEGSIWFCLADGSGGSGHGAKASNIITTFLEEVSELHKFSEPDEFENLLRQVDQQILLSAEGGETTAIIGKIEKGIVIGASVGDSEAWLYNQDYEYELTSLQIPKPLLGSGRAIPIGFGPIKLDHAMLIGSDGLFKYTKQNDVHNAVRSKSNAKEIASLAKIQTGKLQDDISVICVIME